MVNRWTKLRNLARYLTTWHHAAIAVSTVIALGSAVFSYEQAVEARRQAKEAQRASDIAQRNLDLQTPQLSIQIEKDEDGPVVMQQNARFATIALDIPAKITIYNKSTSPAGVRSIRVTWVGIDFSYSTSPGVHIPLSKSEGQIAPFNKAAEHHSVVAPDESATVLDPLPPFIIESSGSKRVQLSLKLNVDRDFPLSNQACEGKFGSGLVSRGSGDHCEKEPWTLKNLRILDQLVANLNAGKDLFGWSASTNEPYTDTAELVRLLVSVETNNGIVCKANLLWHYQELSEGTTCTQQ